MQILHPFAGSVQQYTEQLANPDSYRPGHCPQCQAKHPLTAHGFYTRTVIDTAFDGVIRVRRYLCEACRRTVSLLPEFVLPYLRSSLSVIALFLITRLLLTQRLSHAAQTAPPPMPYQRGQFWIRRFRAQAESLCAALAALTKPTPAPDFVHRALTMLQSTGWVAAHRRRSRLSFPTHHLHGTVRPFCLRFGTGENSMDDKAEKVALFRYGLIAPLVLETLPRGELTRRAQEVAARLYDIPHSNRRQVSVDTLLDWTLRYRRNGLAALSPKPRQDRGQTRAVAPETAALIERLKRENPHRTGAALLRELAVTNERNQAGLSASTLYRFLRARGLTERQLLLDKATAHKKYEAQFANQIWQPDMLFGPWVERPGGGKQQVFLQAALDDASRLIPHAQFYPNQGLDAFLDCLRQAIAARGIPTRLYMDNAKIYRSPQLARIVASIGILIVHTPPYQPEGRGKIERFFRSVREQFLASLDPKVLLSLAQLNERLWHWLDTDYHRREHSSLQTTPLLRWQRDIEQVRQLPPATDLRRLFFHRVDRLVRKDSTFLLKNRFFEAPSHLAGKRIEVRFDPLDLTQLEIYSGGKPEGVARLVDAVVNGMLPPWETEEK